MRKKDKRSSLSLIRYADDFVIMHEDHSVILKSRLLKSQKGKCNSCGLTFRQDDVLEVDHIIPKSKGGTDYYKNLQILHRHCHDKKTAIDGSNEPLFKPAKLPQGWYWSEGMLIT